MSISSVSTTPVAQIPPKLDSVKAAPPPPADNDKGSEKSTTSAPAQAAAPSAADAAKAQTAANAKVNTDGTVGPHHKKRVLHPGQAGYKPPTQSAPASSSTQTTGTAPTGVNVKV